MWKLGRNTLVIATACVAVVLLFLYARNDAVPTGGGKEEEEYVRRSDPQEDRKPSAANVPQIAKTRETQPEETEARDEPETSPPDPGGKYEDVESTPAFSTPAVEERNQQDEALPVTGNYENPDPGESGSTLSAPQVIPVPRTESIPPENVPKRAASAGPAGIATFIAQPEKIDVEESRTTPPETLPSRGQRAAVHEEPHFEDPVSDSHIRMLPSAENVMVGDQLTVTIEIENAVDVRSVPFRVLFNPDVLSFVQGQEGPFLGSDGGETVFISRLATHGNEVFVGLSRVGRSDGIDGAGILCYLEFDVIGAGSGGLSFARGKVRDAASRLLPSVFENAKVVGLP